MSQTFQKDYIPTDAVNQTMTEVIEDNCASLRTNFEGASNAPSPERSQWTSNTSDKKLRIYDQTGGTENSWLDVFNFDQNDPLLAPGVILSDDVVTTATISNLARKGSIVEDEAISPFSCELQKQVKQISLPSYTEQVLASLNLTDIGVGGRVLFTTRIYIPSKSGVLRYYAKQKSCRIQFTIGAEVSSLSNEVLTTAAWCTTPAEMSFDTVTEGWFDFTLRANPVPISGSSIFAVQALAFEWGASPI